MAYFSQEMKKLRAPVIRDICNRYGVKATLAVRHHSSLVLNISQGAIDFIGNYNQVQQETQHMYQRAAAPAQRSLSVNPYWYQEHFTGVALDFLNEVIEAMNQGNHDRSDIQTDYFDVGWYIDVNIGKWDRPYVLTSRG